MSLCGRVVQGNNLHTCPYLVVLRAYRTEKYSGAKVQTPEERDRALPRLLERLLSIVYIRTTTETGPLH